MFFPDYFSGLTNGYTCTRQVENMSQAGMMACKNLKSPDSAIKILDFTEYYNIFDLNISYQSIIDPTGLWIAARGTKGPGILHYDFTTGLKEDTNIGQYAKSIRDNRALRDHRFISCGIDKYAQLAAFYFDGKTWTATNTVPKKYKCLFSAGGNGEELYLENENIWLYYDFRVSQYSKFKQAVYPKKSLRRS
jgi:hypothetical protein